MSKKKPKHDFPAGNAAVGDSVWYLPAGIKRPSLEDWQKVWRVTAVGLENKHGYFLDIKIVNIAGEERQIAPFLRLTGMGTDDEYLLLPDPKKLPIRVKKVLAEHTNLIAVRDGDNSNDMRLQLFCLRCLSLLQINRDEKTTSDLCFSAPDNQFHEGKPCIMDGDTIIRCDCPKDFTYEIEFDGYV